MERRAGAYARFRRLASCTKLPNTEGLAVKSTDLMLLSNVKLSNPYQSWTWRSVVGHESMAYSYIKQQWTKGGAEFHGWLRNAAIGWRKEPVVKRVLRPTRLDRARRLGYKPIQGIIIARVRVRRGGARKPRPVSGRRQKAMGIAKYTRAISLQRIAEGRAGQKYPNLEVRNSYPVYSDGKSHWFEVILRDPHHPAQK